MKTREAENLRRKVDAIIGPLFLRPRRARELSDELYDHAREAAEAGEPDPVATLGPPKVIRRSINWLYLLETLAFVAAFLVLYSLWRTIWDPDDIRFTRFSHTFPYLNYHIACTSYRQFFRFLMYFLFFSSALVMAFTMRRYMHLTFNRRWFRWVGFLVLIFVLDFLLLEISRIIFNFLILQETLAASKAHSISLRYLAASFAETFATWSVPHADKLGVFAYRWIILLAFVATPIGFIAFSSRSLSLIRRMTLLLALTVTMMAIDYIHIQDIGITNSLLWFLLSYTIYGFGYGFWMGFYFAAFDWIWDKLPGLVTNARKQVFTS